MIFHHGVRSLSSVNSPFVHIWMGVCVRARVQRNDKDLNLTRQQNVSFVYPVTQLLFVPALK